MNKQNGFLVIEENEKGTVLNNKGLLPNDVIGYDWKFHGNDLKWKEFTLDENSICEEVENGYLYNFKNNFVHGDILIKQ